MVKVKAAGAADVSVVVRGVPLSAGQGAFRALHRCDDRFGLEDLCAGVAAVVVGVGPVLELAALEPEARPIPRPSSASPATASASCSPCSATEPSTNPDPHASLDERHRGTPRAIGAAAAVVSTLAVL